MKKFDEFLGGVEHIKNEDIIAVVGFTGCGKSTLCASISVKDSVMTDEEEGFIKRPDTKIVCIDEPMFEISSGSISATSMPGFMPLKDDKGNNTSYLVDTPGQSDTNRMNEFPNQACIHSLLKHSRTFKVILLVTYAILAVDRGAQLLQLVTSIIRLYKVSGQMNDLS